MHSPCHLERLSYKRLEGCFLASERNLHRLPIRFAFGNRMFRFWDTLHRVAPNESTRENKLLPNELFRVRLFALLRFARGFRLRFRFGRLALFVGVIGCDFGHGFGRVDPLDEGNACGVTLAFTELDNPGVSTLALGAARRDVGEKFLHGIFLPQHRESSASRVERILLPERDHFFRKRTNSFSFRQRRLDALMLN